MRPRVLIIGGSGFVGSRLIDRLGRGWWIRNLDLRESGLGGVDDVVGDVRDQRIVDHAISGSETVILLAAAHRDDVRPLSLYQEVNVSGTRCVLEAMERHTVKHLIFTSSVAVYGIGIEDMPNESSPLLPFNEYGRTKAMAEELIRGWAAKGGGRSATIVRPTVIFGEGNRGNVYNLIRQIALGRFVMVGKGENRKAMAYVENVARFLEFCMDNAEPGYSVYNYADLPDFRMRELVYRIRAYVGRRGSCPQIPVAFGMGLGRVCDGLSFLMGRELPFSAVRVRKFCANSQVSVEKVTASGFEAEVALRDGLTRTLEFELGKRTVK